jgi:hypothetical protein
MVDGKATVRIDLPRLHAAQIQVLSEAVRFSVVDCGRQWGKTTMGKELVIRPALAGYPTAWMSPSYKSLDESFEEVKSTTEPLWNRKGGSKDEQQKQLCFPGGGKIEFWSLEDPDGPRGRKYKRLVVDEAALIKNLKETWERSLRALIAFYRGDVWFFSTPRGIGNDFYTLYQWGQDPEKGNWKSWKMPSWTNPYLAAEEIEEIRDGLSELAFNQEYGGDFLSYEGAVFVNVGDAVNNNIVQSTGDKVIAVDWAGTSGRGDFTVFSAVDTGGELVEMERFRGLTYPHQMGKLKTFIGRHNPIKTLAESNNMGQPLIDQLRSDGVAVDAFVTSNASKQAAVESLALAFERRQIKIPDNPVLIGELQSFESHQLPGGLVRYAAAGSGHDDTVIPLAIAWYYLAKNRGGSLGLIEWLKQTQARMDSGDVTLNKQGIVTPAVAKPAIGDQTERCPQCGGTCIQNMGAHVGKRCGSCGAQFGAADTLYKGKNRVEHFAKE